MQRLHQLDRSVERPMYSNEEVAELHHNGLLSRAEAEVLDIIQTEMESVGTQGIAPTVEVEAQYGASWEPSCVAIVHEGTVIPVLDLEELIQRSRTSAEKLVLCKQVSSIIYDVLLALLEEEGGGEQ